MKTVKELVLENNEMLKKLLEQKETSRTGNPDPKPPKPPKT